jgi:hypothetical protein
MLKLKAAFREEFLYWLRSGQFVGVKKVLAPSEFPSQ